MMKILKEIQISINIYVRIMIRILTGAFKLNMSVIKISKF